MAFQECILMSCGPAEQLSIAATEATKTAACTKKAADNFDFNAAAQSAVDYVREHPYETAFHVGGAIIIFIPGVVTIPVLDTLGFTVMGVRAGKLAPWPGFGMNLPAKRKS